MKLIVGLGNPGRKYERTRHNFGFLLVDRLAANLGEKIIREDCDALVLKTALFDRPCLLAKPQTYMNLSGQAVARLISKHHLEPARDLLVAYDDVALPLGKLRLRAKGSAGGHNGMKSIIAQLGGQEFPRLRLGILSEERDKEEDLADFVLAKFNKGEEEIVTEMLERAEAVIRIWFDSGFDAAMAFCNKEAGESKGKEL